MSRGTQDTKTQEGEGQRTPAFKVCEEGALSEHRECLKTSDSARHGFSHSRHTKIFRFLTIGEIIHSFVIHSGRKSSKYLQ